MCCFIALLLIALCAEGLGARVYSNRYTYTMNMDFWDIVEQLSKVIHVLTNRLQELATTWGVSL